MNDNYKIVESYNLYHNRMSDLSFVLLRYYWDLKEYMFKDTSEYNLRQLYDVYSLLLVEYKKLNKLVYDMDNNWNSYYRMSYDKEFNYEFIDRSSPKRQLEVINLNLMHIIPIQKIQRKYKLWYKKKLKSIRKIQKNWKISRYNPAYKLCWLTQINNIKLFGKIKFKDIDVYIN